MITFRIRIINIMIIIMIIIMIVMITCQDSHSIGEEWSWFLLVGLQEPLKLVLLYFWVLLWWSLFSTGSWNSFQVVINNIFNCWSWSSPSDNRDYLEMLWDLILSWLMSQDYLKMCKSISKRWSMKTGHQNPYAGADQLIMVKMIALLISITETQFWKCQDCYYQKT